MSDIGYLGLAHSPAMAAWLESTLDKAAMSSPGYRI